MNEGKKVYEKICSCLDEIKREYVRFDDRLTVGWAIEKTREEDKQTALLISVNEALYLIQLFIEFPFEMPQEKMVEGAIAAVAVSERLGDGSIDYNILNGKIGFRLTASYLNGEPNRDLISYMLSIASSTMSDVVPKFYMLSEGMITVEDIIKEGMKTE